MPNCFTCRKACKMSTSRFHVCDECVHNLQAKENDATPWTEFRPATLHPDLESEGFSDCYKNSRYTVLWRNVRSEVGELVHLSIKRNDKNVIHDWRDLQRIKNEILGPEHEAMELYPAESRLVDSANQYHLWCFLNQRAPFGYDAERCVMEDAGPVGGKQRPFEKKPDDLLTEEQWQVKYKAHQEKKVASAGYVQQIKSILDAASGRRCQQFAPDGHKCDEVWKLDPGNWCGPCMAQVIRKLGDEASSIR